MPTADDVLSSDAERGIRLFERVLCLIRLLALKLQQTQDDDGEMLLRARENPLFLDAPSVLYRAFNELTGADLSVPRQKEHNNMCLAIEKMKEKGRREERKKALKAIEDWMSRQLFF